MQITTNSLSSVVTYKCDLQYLFLFKKNPKYYFEHDFTEQITVAGTKEKVSSCVGPQSCTSYLGGLADNLIIDFALFFSMKCLALPSPKGIGKHEV